MIRLRRIEVTSLVAPAGHPRRRRVLRQWIELVTWSAVVLAMVRIAVAGVAGIR